MTGTRRARLPAPARGWRAALAALVLAGALSAGAASANVASDPWITQRAKMLLLVGPEVDATELHVDSTNGRVTLFGTVRSEQGKAAAERIVRHVIGVRSVRNLLTVVPASARPAVTVDNQTLEENVALALRGDPVLANSAIRVESVDAGTVVLGGRAASLSEQYRALDVARRVAGVTRVASVIESPQLLTDAEIWGTAAGARRDAAANARLTNAVKVRLIADPRVPALDVSVDAVDGVVTLFGVVPTDAAKRATEKVARSAQGVTQVRNQLLVREDAAAAGGLPAGGDVRGAVVRALDELPALDDADIVVSLQGDAVQLSGRVSNQADHLTALSAARRVAGARGVIDRLTVAPPQDGES